MRSDKIIGFVCALLAVSVCQGQEDWFREVFGSREKALKARSSLVRIEYDANVICLGGAVSLSVDHSAYGSVGNFSYCWKRADDTTVLGRENTLFFRPQQTGIYAVFVEVKDDGMAVGNDTLSIYVTEMPEYRMVSDTVCRGDEATIGVVGGNYWAWSTSGTTQYVNVRPASTSLYRVRISNFPIVEVGYENACYAEDSVWVVVHDTAVYEIAGPTEVCKGTDTELKVIGGTDVYWGGVPGSETAVVNVYSDTAVTVSATDRYGCREEKEWRLTVIDNPQGEIFVYVEGLSVDSICLGKKARLEVVSSQADRYVWFNRDTTYYTELEPKADFEAYCDIMMTGVDSECKTRISRKIPVENCSRIYFASGFVPEGYSKTFGPIGIEDSSRTYFFAVFDNKGIMVFSTTEFSQGWDGTYKGKPVPPGTYVYVFRETYDRFTWEKKGTVSVLR